MRLFAPVQPLFLGVALAQGAVVTHEPPPPKVRVNRTVPNTEPVPAFPVFSRKPTDQEISRARVFGEPLVPVGGPTSIPENVALADALGRYLRGGDHEDTTALTEFLGRYPRSPWRASLLTNMGAVYRRAGRYSKALAVWEQAWPLSKDEDSTFGRAVADSAVAELAALNAGLGRCRRLETLLDEVEGRDIRGPAQEKLAGARQGLWLMQHQPARAFRCGQMALERIAAYKHEGHRGSEPPDLRATRSTHFGTSLVQLEDLAHMLGLKMRMARRIQGSTVLVPAVVHWEVGPFAAVMAEANGRFLVHDPSFAEDTWMSPRTLDEEASGYFLVPEGPLPQGWAPVDDAEGERIWYPMPSILADSP